MSDAIKINLHSRQDDPELWEHAEKFVGEPGKIYVFAHGSPNSIADDRKGMNHRKSLSPLELAKILEEAGATTDSKIFLHSCSTGQGVHSFARELSHYFAEVEGATRLLYDQNSVNEEEFRHLSRISGKSTPGLFLDESAEMAVALKGSDPGRMKQFHTQDYLASITHPELVDSVASEHPTNGPRYWTEKKDGITQYNSGNSKRDFGDEQPVTASMPDIEKSRPIKPSEVTVIAKEYVVAINMHSDGARKQAEEKYPELKIAFSYHDKMMAHAKSVSNPDIVEKSINQHIANNILEGKFSALMDTEQHVAQR